MDVYDCIRTRLTVRRFKPDPVPEEEVDKILRAAQWAPSFQNLQSWHFIVVKDCETLTAMGWIAASGRFVADAPLAIAIAMDNADRPDLDAGRVLQQMELITILPFGYRKEGIDSGTRKRRKLLSEIVHGERFGEAFSIGTR